ncbi:hypothetical protein N7G274_009498 [Stereocaulon virgatum]|uniref:Uncharacterized protein n=1 Tax=Stereocaulon virgatum TaxID=373712 RepID=A0ABR3ZYD8_9LECA
MEAYSEAVQAYTRTALGYIRNLNFSVSSTNQRTGTKKRITDIASSPQPVDAESKFTIASDGQKDCLALLTTKEIVEKIQYDLNLIGIDFYELFDLRVNLEVNQDADLLPCEDTLEHQDWEKDRSVTMFSAQNEETEVTSEGR